MEQLVCLTVNVFRAEWHGQADNNGCLLCDSKCSPLDLKYQIQQTGTKFFRWNCSSKFSDFHVKLEWHLTQNLIQSHFLKKSYPYPGLFL